MEKPSVALPKEGQQVILTTTSRRKKKTEEGILLVFITTPALIDEMIHPLTILQKKVMFLADRKYCGLLFS